MAHRWRRASAQTKTHYRGAKWETDSNDPTIGLLVLRKVHEGVSTGHGMDVWHVSVGGADLRAGPFTTLAAAKAAAAKFDPSRAREMWRVPSGAGWDNDPQGRARFTTPEGEYRVVKAQKRDGGVVYLVTLNHRDHGWERSRYPAAIQLAKSRPGRDTAKETDRMDTMAKKSKAITKHRETAMENPGPKTTGLLWVAALAGIGAIIGAARATTGARGSAALSAAEQGVGLATVGGTVVGFLSEGMRNSGFATAGIGLVVIMGLGVVTYVTTASTSAAAPPPATS